jgi:predicted ATP-grasp superfamily ATP-dependent carboligase
MAERLEMAATEMPNRGTLPAPRVTNQGSPVTVVEDSRDYRFDVLVLDGASKQSLASTRSLGRAGLRVAVGECASDCDPAGSALSFRSRYARGTVVLPSVASDATAFADAVVEFVRTYHTRVVLPTADGAIMALMPYRERLGQLGSVLALASDAALEVANDKDRTLAVAHDLGIDYPKTMRISDIGGLPAVVGAFGFPFVLKPTVSFPRDAPVRLQVVDVINEAEAVSAIEAYQSAGAGVLAQQWASGRREGVSLFVVGGEVRAACGHVAHRTSPALGGASVLRESVPIQPEIYGPAVRLVTAIGLEGVCEVEFRRDAGGRPLLMEINARLAGTIENAVHSGVDFPLLIWQWATGQPVDQVAGYRAGVRTRWLHGDMRWLRDNHQRVGRPDSVSRIRAVSMFGLEFLRTRHLDCIDRHDLRPSVAEIRTTARAVRKSRGAPSPANPESKGASLVS